MVYKSSSIAPDGGGGSGSVSNITSTGGTISVMNPAGPTTNIDAKLATSLSPGIVQPDNATITISGGVISAVAGGAGTVTNVSGVTANGFAFSIANPATTPAITASTTITGILKGDGTAISAVSNGGISNSLLANSSVTVSGVSGVTGGGTVALGSAITLGMAGNLANTLAGYNSSGVFSDVSIGSNLSLVDGVLNGTVGPASVTSVFGRTGSVVANYGDYAFNLVSGTAAVSQGGTGLQTLTNHAVLLGEGVSAVSFATTGTAARLLIDQGNADPAFKSVSGDSSLASTGAMVNLAVNGVAYPASPSTNTVPVVTGTNQITYESVPNAALSNSAITIGAGTGLTGGGSVPLGGATTLSMTNTSLTVSGVSGITGGGIVALGAAITLGMAGNTANTLSGYNNSGVFSDVSLGSNLSLVNGVLNGTNGPAPVTSVFSRTGAVTAQWNDYNFNLIGGTAAVSQGGTGQASLTAHAVLLGEGAVTGVGFATTGTAARILMDQGGIDPAFKVISGDISAISTGAITVLQVNGVAYPSSPSTNTAPIVTGSNTITYQKIPNTVLSNSAITIGAQTGLAGGGSVALGSAITLSMGTGAINSLTGYNSSGVFSGVSVGSNLSLSGGVLNGTILPATVTSVFGRTGAVAAQWNDYNFNLIGGTASVSQGGTGQVTLPAHAVLLGEGATTGVGAATTGTAGRLLFDQGGIDPAFKIITGDVSAISTGAFTVNKVNSVAYPASPSTNTVPVVTSSNVVTYQTIPNAVLTNSAITIGAQTGLAGGGSVALGSAITISMGTGSVNSLGGYNSSGVYSGVSIGSNLSLSGGILNGTVGPITQASRNSAQYDATSNTVLTDVPGLTATVVSGGVYDFSAHLITVVGAGVGGAQVAIKGTATSTTFAASAFGVNGTGVSASGNTTTFGGAILAATTFFALIEINGSIVVNAGGTLTVQFAQNVSQLTPSSVLIGSSFTITKI